MPVKSQLWGFLHQRPAKVEASQPSGCNRWHTLLCCKRITRFDPGDRSAMVRMTELIPSLQDALDKDNSPTFEGKPFVGGPPLSARRVAVVTSAGLSRRGDT